MTHEIKVNRTDVVKSTEVHACAIVTLLANCSSTTYRLGGIILACVRIENLMFMEQELLNRSKREKSDISRLRAYLQVGNLDT